MSAINAYGNFKLLKGNSASPEVFTAVAGIRSFQMGDEYQYNDSTTFSSVGAYKEKTPAGAQDPGTASIKIFFDPADATYSGLLTDKNAQTLRNWKVEKMTGSNKKTDSFAAYVKSVSHSYEVDGFLECDVQLELTGAITYNA